MRTTNRSTLAALLCILLAAVFRGPLCEAGWRYVYSRRFATTGEIAALAHTPDALRKRGIL